MKGFPWTPTPKTPQQKARIIKRWREAGAPLVVARAAAEGRSDLTIPEDRYLPEQALTERAKEQGAGVSVLRAEK